MGAAVVVIVFGLILGSIFWTGVYWLGVSTVAAGLATIAYQVLVRLSDGYWLSWTVRDAVAALGFNDTGSTSSGTNSIIPWVVALPIGLGLILLGLGLGCIGEVGQAAAARREDRGVHNF